MTASSAVKIVDVRGLVNAASVFDPHNHLVPAQVAKIPGASNRVKGLVKWGIVELLNYHYLIAEALHGANPDEVARFFSMTERERADYIWRRCFLENAPVSEAALGVLQVLKMNGFSEIHATIAPYIEYFRSLDPEAYEQQVLRNAGVACYWQTCDPLNPAEQEAYVLDASAFRTKFARTALRIDSAVGPDARQNPWPAPVGALNALGYPVTEQIDAGVCAKFRRYLSDWYDKLGADYLMLSLPPDFSFGAENPVMRLISTAIEFARERSCPFFLMPGVKRQINPKLGLAGDGVGRILDRGGYEQLFEKHHDVQFWMVILPDEDQEWAAVTCRKFPNMHLCGCWWWNNRQSKIEELTRGRLELLGPRFFANHTDCRILDQLLYKTGVTRAAVGNVLVQQFDRQSALGFPVSEAQVVDCVEKLLGRKLLTWHQ